MPFIIFHSQKEKLYVLDIFAAQFSCCRLGSTRIGVDHYQRIDDGPASDRNHHRDIGSAAIVEKLIETGRSAHCLSRCGNSHKKLLYSFYAQAGF